MLACDLWPAEAVLPDGRVVRGCRVMLTRTGTLVVWADVTGVAKPVWAGPVEPVTVPDRNTAWRQARLVATSPDGQQVVANATRPSGCGCGSSALAHLTGADAAQVERSLAPATR